MASVQYLIEDSFTSRRLIYERKCVHHEATRDLHWAAIRIQRWWRGWMARIDLRRRADAAGRIQSTFRGWRVRFHLADFISTHLRRRNDQYFNELATRIQAVWRGYSCRKKLPERMNMVRRKGLHQQMSRANAWLQGLMADLLNRMRGGPKTPAETEEEERRCREWVMYILFKCHHLVRTFAIEGVYSDHDQKERSQIEKMLAAVPMRGYVDELHRKYDKLPPCKNEFRYELPTLKNMEAALMERYVGNDVKEEPFDMTPSIHDKAFNLNCRLLPKGPYERQMLAEGPYKPRITDIIREDRPHLNVSRHDFDVSKKITRHPSNKKTYHINAWKAKKCSLHHLHEYSGKCD